MTLENTGTNGCGAERSVQDRLLDAAEGLFCDHGFDGTGVRDIAALADCNVASVNYYFGGKDGLYVEVWRRILARMRESRLSSIERAMAGNKQPELEQLLRTYAESFVEPLIQHGGSGRVMLLMAREMIDQRLPPDMFIKEMIVPVMTALSQALMSICEGLNEKTARLAILSVVGQLMQMIHVVDMFAKSGYSEVLPVEPAEVIDHIVKFSYWFTFQP